MKKTLQQQCCALLLLLVLLLGGSFAAAHARCNPIPFVSGAIVPDNAIFCIGEPVAWASEICYKPEECCTGYVRPNCFWDVTADNRYEIGDPIFFSNGWCAMLTLNGPAYHTIDGGMIVFDEPGTGTVTGSITEATPGCRECIRQDGPWTPTEANFKVVKVDIRTDSNNDGHILDDDDPIEEDCPGLLVAYNDDDDNGNRIVDRHDTTVAGEDDLAEVVLTCAPISDMNGWTVRLMASDGSPYIRAWVSPEKGTGISLPKTYTVGIDTFPITVYIEGYDLGETMLDLVLIKPDGTEACRDKAKLTVLGGRITALDNCGDYGKYLLLANPASASPTDRYRAMLGQPGGTTFTWEVSDPSKAHIVGSSNRSTVDLQADAEGDFKLKLTYTRCGASMQRYLETAVQKPNKDNSWFTCGGDYGMACVVAPPVYEIHRDVTYWVIDGAGRPVPHADWDESWTGSALPPGGWDGPVLCDGHVPDFIWWRENVVCDGTGTVYKQDTQTIEVSGWPGGGASFWGPWTVQWTFAPHIYHSGCGN